MHWFFLLCGFFSLAVQGLAQCPVIELDLETAWLKVLSHSPTLSAAQSEIGIHQAEKRQALLLPNPILVIEAENIGVSDHDRGAEPPQTTYAISQLVELGGKRAARFQLAQSEVDLAYCENQLAIADVRLAFLHAFITVAYAHEKWHVAQRHARIAHCAFDSINKEMGEGKVSPLHQKKGSLGLKTAQLCLREAELAFKVAKKKLASFWGSPCSDFDIALFNLFCSDIPPCLTHALNCVTHSPDYALAKSRVCVAKKEFHVQQTFRVPDVILTVGYRRFQDSHEHGWVAGVEMPIPSFNLNQGNIQRASRCVCKTEYLLDELMWKLEENISVVWEQLRASYEESEMIGHGILCEAREALALTEKGYQLEKIDYFELLDAQKRVCEIEERYLDVLYNYHLSRAELARLTGL